MAFTDLSLAQQNIIMLNFEMWGKAFLLVIPLLLSLLYIYYFWERKTQTPYILAASWRALWYWMSKIYIFLFPLTLFFMYPQFELANLLQLLVTFYAIAIIVIMITAILNALYYTPVIMLRYGGFNIDIRGNNKALDMIEKQWGLNSKWRKE